MVVDKAGQSPVHIDYIGQLQDWMRAHLEDMIGMLWHVAEMESPTIDPLSQEPIFQLFSDFLKDSGYKAVRFRGKKTGGQLLAYPADRKGNSPIQLLLGHCDTVWPHGTLEEMPLIRQDGRLSGPGVFDMKGGLVQILFAVRALRELQLTPPIPPVVFINSDEEIGSPESARKIDRLARIAQRAFVLEPSLGLEGRLKTARRGGGEFHISVHGKASHSGLAPEEGVSAILELSHVIQKLFQLNDSERNISVNVGVIEGGLRSNIIAPAARAHVDVRIGYAEDVERIENAINELKATLEGTRIEIQGGIKRLPMERNARNQRLWRLARDIGARMGLELTEGTSGGGSDGNITTLHTATLDGLGPVGDGAHARHEFIFVDSLAERATLLALLLLAE